MFAYPSAGRENIGWQARHRVYLALGPRHLYLSFLASNPLRLIIPSNIST